MATSTVDYTGLAKQFGGVPDENAQPAPQQSDTDYATLAKQFGGVPDTPPPPSKSLPAPAPVGPSLWDRAKDVVAGPGTVMGNILPSPPPPPAPAPPAVPGQAPPSPYAAPNPEAMPFWKQAISGGALNAIVPGLGDIAPSQAMDKPILDFSAAKAEDAIPGNGPVSRGARGIVSGLESAATGMTTPENVGFMAATGGMPPVISRLVGAGFGYKMLKDAYDQAPEFKKAVDAGDVGSAARIGTQLFTSGVLGTLGLAHGAVDLKNLLKTEPTAAYEARQSAKPPSERDLGAGGTPGAQNPEVMTGPQPAPEPVKPTQTDHPGPRTPVPPTVAQPTAPEAPETLDTQLQQMGQGLRKVVMVPKSNLDQGYMPSAPLPAGVSLTADTYGNRYYFDKQQGMTADKVRSAAKNNTLPEILGGPVGMQAPDKSVIAPGQAVVVTAHGPDGKEVQSTATVPQMLPETLAATEPLVPPGGGLQVKSPEEAVAGRVPSQLGQVPSQLGESPLEAAIRRPVEPGPVGMTPAPNTGPPRAESDHEMLMRGVPAVEAPVPTPLETRMERQGQMRGLMKPNALETSGQTMPPAKPGQELFRGAWDVPLNDAGHQDALDVAKRTAGQFDEIHASPLGRAQTTAAEVAKTNPQAGPVKTNPVLAPWTLGGHEGAPVTPERIKDLNDHIANPDQPLAGIGRLSGRPGESFNDFKDPLIDHVVNQVANYEPGQRILNVTHYRDIRAVDAWLKAGGLPDRTVDTKAMTTKGKEKPGQMFRLDPETGAMTTAKDAKEPGIYFLRHGETAANEGASPAVSQSLPGSDTKPNAELTKPVSLSVNDVEIEKVSDSGGVVGNRGKIGGRVLPSPAPVGEKSPQSPTVPAEYRATKTKLSPEAGVGNILLAPYEAAKAIAEVLHPYTDAARSLVAPQTRGDLAKFATGTLRNMEGIRMRRQAQAKAAFEKFRDDFQKRPASYQVNSPNADGIHGLDVIDAIEGGPTQIASLDPAGQAFAKLMRPEFDKRKAELASRGILNTFRENYFRHAWKEPGTKAGPINTRAKRPLAGPESFRKQRTYDTLSEGLNDSDFTLVPRYDNPVDYVLDGLSEMDRSITGHDVFDEWRQAGALPFYRNGAKVPDGYSKINDKIFTVFGPKKGAVKVPSDAIHSGASPTATHGAPVDPNEITVYGKREMGNYYAPDEIATTANNFLGQGLSATKGGPLFDAWMKLKGGMNMLNLGFSGFHGLTTSMNSSLSDLGLGIMQLAHGKPGEATKSMAQFSVPGLSPVRDVIRGTYLEKVYNGEIKDPVAEAAMQALEKAGGSPQQAMWDPDHFWKGMKKSWDEGSKGVAIAKALNPLLWSEQYPITKAIMTKMVPRVKLAAFERAMQHEVEAHPGMGVDEARERFGKIWDSMDDRFGQLNQKNMMMNNVVKDVINATVGRFGWSLGTLRQAFGGSGDLLHGQLSHRAAAMIASIIGAAFINGVANAILTGTAPKGKDFVMPRTGGFDENGNPARAVLPLYLAKDYYSWATRPVATAKAKLTPALMAAGDLAENKNFKRQKIYGKGGIGWRYLVDLFAPYAASGALQNVERGQSAAKTLLPEVGVMPANRYASMSKAEKILSDYQEDHAPTTRAAPTVRSKARQDVFLAAKSGDVAKAQQLGHQAVAAGKMSTLDVNHAIQSARTSPLLASVKRSDVPLSVVLEAYEAATPEQKEQIKGAVRQKVANARGKPWEWEDPDTKTRAMKFFSMQPFRGLGSPAPAGR